jgi:hypothetical protein
MRGVSLVHPPTLSGRRHAGIVLSLALALAAAGLMTALPAAHAARPAAKPAQRPGIAHSPARKSARGHSKAPTARASLCSAPMVGNWHNINGSTNAMTRALVDFDCQDVILCDTNGHCTGGDSSYYMRVFGKCSPTDCDWGRKRADDMGGGWIRSIYGFGFKTSYVWLKTYNYYGLTYLRVWVNNDFAWWDGRTDYITDEWFLR